LTAWLIRAGTLLCGQTALGVRSMGVLVSALAVWVVFLMGKRVGLTPRESVVAATVSTLVLAPASAAVIMTPLLTLFADLIGVMGGSIVLLSMGYSLDTYLKQIFSMVNYVDLLGGLFKSIVFGLLVSGIGCLRGLQTGIGASAVGDSTTRAVVGGIVLIVVTDGIFSVVYYYLGI